MKAKRESADFDKVQAGLKARGFQEKDVTIPSGKAMVLGVVCALPFVIVLGALYRLLFLERAHLLDVSGLSFYVLFLAIIAVSVVIHEGLHGVGWAIACGQGWKAVRFNLNAMMPSCACKVALEKKSYLMGVLAPFAVLGLGSILFVCAYPGTVSLLTLMVIFIAAGADLLIALHVFREGNCLLADHPTEAGYIAFYKSGSV